MSLSIFIEITLCFILLMILYKVI